MENKFILVPSDLYTNMMKRDTGELSLENSKQQLQNAMNRSKLDKSTQNILYNQQLKRFLKMRNERENKPVKVELTNGDKILINPGELINQMKKLLSFTLFCYALVIASCSKSINEPPASSSGPAPSAAPAAAGR